MTLMLILGGIAAFYMLALLFRCAMYALPVGAGIWVGVALHASGSSGPLSIIIGLLTAAFSLAASRHFIHCSSPFVRGVIATLFVAPSGMAGYHAVAAIVDLVVAPGLLATLASLAGASMTAVAARRRLQNTAGKLARTSSPHR